MLIGKLTYRSSSRYKMAANLLAYASLHLVRDFKKLGGETEREKRKGLEVYSDNKKISTFSDVFCL